MGGSGGGYFTRGADPGDLARKIRDAQAQVRDDAYETNVNQLLQEFLKEFNDRDAAGIREILDDIKKALADVVGGTVDLIFGGSVSRHTYLEGLSDIDALVIMEADEVERKSPEHLKERFAQKLRELYGSDNVKAGDLAVTVTVGDKEIQLLPAMREGDGYRIASPDGRSWSKINPKAFAQKLTQANKMLDGKLIPAIKLAKAIIASLPERQRLTGYHVECLAIEAFKNYNGPRTCKAMVTHFFEKAPEFVKTPLKDKTGQSLYVDEYLGSQNSTERRVASQALQRLHRRLVNANASRSTETWSELLSVE